MAVYLVINYEEGSEVHMASDGRSESILGERSLRLESQCRDLALESVYEYEARAGIWRLRSNSDTCAAGQSRHPALPWKCLCPSDCTQRRMTSPEAS